METVIDTLHSQLSVLGKAVQYKNLSGAAEHVGLSQPQLSRIISKLESELKVVLLDRSVRRQSGWTPLAHKIADTYARHSRKLTQQISQLGSDEHVTRLTIGTLEGLQSLAGHICKQLFESTKVQTIEIDVYDLSALEERFERDELDFVLTCREPGRQKAKNLLTLGYQTFEKHGTATSEIQVFSNFEFSTRAEKPKIKRPVRTLVSNSLAMRELWIKEFGGSGFFPSEVRKKKTNEPSEVPVYLIGSELLNPTVWGKIQKFPL